LTNPSSSYFDQYLDEIVYFFERTKYDVVIIEDVDRFNDPYIFETLRELNILLNTSKQITPRTITFLYAVKDSIFEQLGRISVGTEVLTIEEIRELAVTNRTKFFDFVLPVVPFISRHNSRDLLKKQLDASGFEISANLVKIVSKYLVDMRLIKNVINEFAIFRKKILGPNHIPELAADQLFAMVVYKNLNLADFEKIKQGESQLDSVFAGYRDLVNESTLRLNREIAELTSSASYDARRESLARALGTDLQTMIQSTIKAIGGDETPVVVTLEDESIELEELTEPDFWRRWTHSQQLELSINFNIRMLNPMYGTLQPTAHTMKYTFSSVQDRLSEVTQARDWVESNVTAVAAEVTQKQEKVAYLIAASIKDLVSRPEFTLNRDGEQHSLHAIISNAADQQSTEELIGEGFIDRNYSLYSSQYYDDTITAKARNFILHAVDTGRMDVNADIGADADISAMIDEVGRTIFVSKSIFNIQIFDFLLSSDDHRLGDALELLLLIDDEKTGFIDAYFGGGKHRAALVEKLAPRWPSILSYLSTSSFIKEGDRTTLFDVAIRAMAPDITYEADKRSRDFVSVNYVKMTTLTEQSELVPESFLAWLKMLGVLLSELDLLSERIRSQVVEQTLYAVTLENLQIALGATSELALDDLREDAEGVYTHVIAHLDAFLKIHAVWPGASCPIRLAANFVNILNDASSQPDAAIDALVSKVPTSWRIENLTSVDQKAWASVVSNAHLKLTFANIAAYLEERTYDEPLAHALSVDQKVLEVDDVDLEDQIALATQTLNSSLLATDIKVKVAKSILVNEVAPYAVIERASVSETLVRELVKTQLIEDSAESFNHFAASAWEVKRGFIQGSTSFAEYLPETELADDDYALIVESDDIGTDVKDSLIESIVDLESSLDARAVNSLLKYVDGRKMTLNAGQLLVLVRSGADADALVPVIVRVLDALSQDELLAILKGMSDPYRRLSITGTWFNLPNTPSNLALADGLRGRDLVSSRDSDPRGPEFRVNMRQSFRQ
jgi:hypothetical protein